MLFLPKPHSHDSVSFLIILFDPVLSVHLSLLEFIIDAGVDDVDVSL